MDINIDQLHDVVEGRVGGRQCGRTLAMCVEILQDLEVKEEKIKAFTPRASVGAGIVESSAGLVFHEYKFNAKGNVLKAMVITPTVQNIRNLEEDIKAFLPLIAHFKKAGIEFNIERLIRSYGFCGGC